MPDEVFLSTSEVEQAQVLDKVIFSIASGIDSVGRTVQEREGFRENRMTNYSIVKYGAAILGSF